MITKNYFFIKFIDRIWKFMFLYKKKAQIYPCFLICYDQVFFKRRKNLLKKFKLNVLNILSRKDKSMLRKFGMIIL